MIRRMRRLVFALSLLAAPAAAYVQVSDVRIIPAPDLGPTPPPVPLPDFAQMGEAELRALLRGHRLDPGARADAIRGLRQRFPSDATTAFALNAEARTHLDLWETDRALALYRQVRTRFARSRDAAVEAEIAAAMQGEVQAIEMAEAHAYTGPPRPVTQADLDPDRPGNRLRREIVDRFAGRTEPAIRRIVAQERFNLIQSETLRSGRHSDPARYMALVREYEESDDPELRRLVARILFDIAGGAGNGRPAITHWDEFLRRFGQSADPELRSLVFDAYDNKHYVLEQLGDDEAAARVRTQQWAWSERNDGWGD
ncbi:MAG TPA: hypothetical protein VGB79_15855 [Allosphingosinicella sp.]|jgi:hypothetical protein